MDGLFARWWPPHTRSDPPVELEHDDGRLPGLIDETN